MEFLMKLMIKSLMMSFVLTLLSSNAFAYGDWITAYKEDSESIDYTYARCYYKTSSYGGFSNQSFSIVIRGGGYSCPYSVEINPLTGEWRE